MAFKNYFSDFWDAFSAFFLFPFLISSCLSLICFQAICRRNWELRQIFTKMEECIMSLFSFLTILVTLLFLINFAIKMALIWSYWILSLKDISFSDGICHCKVGDTIYAKIIQKTSWWAKPSFIISQMYCRLMVTYHLYGSSSLFFLSDQALRPQHSILSEGKKKILFFS